jgi:hypothetical protein
MARLFAANHLPRQIAVFLTIFSVSCLTDAATLKQQTVDDWNKYILATQGQIDKRVSGQIPFLWLDTQQDGRTRVRNGEVLVAPFDEHVPRHVSGGLVHHWIGATFIPGAKMKDILTVIRDYPHYKDFYAPTVIASSVTPGQPPPVGEADRFVLRFRNQAEVAKSALDATYSATYVQLDPQRGYAVAHTTQVQEIDHYGESSQRTLPVGTGNGYLWQLYATTRFVEADNGIYVEAEGIALSRDIPVAVRFIVDPIVRRISREALHTSLMQTGQAVHAYIDKQAKGETASRANPITSDARLSTR